MAGHRFISYLRVSTDKQGESKLGLEAQRHSVAGFVGEGELLAEYVEVESGKRDDNRPQLQRAMARCRLTGAVLVVAKLDRLSRDAAFLLGLSKSGIDIKCVDMPDASTMVFGVMAIMAQHERELISKRTKDALAALKARGVALGGYRGHAISDRAAALGAAANKAAADAYARSVGPMVQELRDAGQSLRQIAAKLADDGIRTPRGGAWTPTAVKNVMARAA